MNQTNAEFDAPLLIERLGLLYNLISQDIKTVSYEELIRSNAKELIPTGKKLNTSKTDLGLRIKQGDINVLIPSRGFFENLKNRKCSE